MKLITVLLLLFSFPAYAYVNTVSLGVIYAPHPEHNDYALSLGETPFFDQSYDSVFGRRYGYSTTRIELGTSFGFYVQNSSGVVLIGLDKDTGIFPLIGVEPLNGLIDLNTSRYRGEIYQGTSMVSMGIQGAYNKCYITPVAKGGGSGGNITDRKLLPHFRWAYGYGMYISCYILNLGIDRTTIATYNIDNVNLKLQFETFAVGAKYEQMGNEQRGFIFYGRNW